MKVVELRQNTPEWQVWRAQHIGGSEAPAVMYVGAKDRYRLWQEKTGRVQHEEPWGEWVDGETPAQRGTRLEPEARLAYSIKTGILAPPACVENTRPGEEFMAASLDGLADDRIQEFKCPTNPRTHMDAKEGVVEPAYWVQMQHGMHCAEKPLCDYGSFFAGEIVVVKVKYNREYCEQRLVPAERMLFTCIQDDFYPFPRGELDLTGDEQGRALLRKLLERKRMVEEATRLYDETEAEMKCFLSQVYRATGLGGVLQWERKRGYIRYKTLPVVQELLDAGANLDQYRGPESINLRLDRKPR